jgi:hypothetical protein
VARWWRGIGWAVLLLSGAASGQQYKALMEQGHYLRAQVQVDEALKSNPRDEKALIAKSEIDLVYNRMDPAVEEAQAAVAAEGNNAAAHAQLAQAIGWRIANSSVSMLQKVAAAWSFRKEVDRALELDPNNVEALSYKAEYYWYVPGILGGSKKKAQEFADRMIALDPAKGYDVKSNFAGEETDKTKRSDALEAIWRQAVAARPSAYDAHVSLGYVYFIDPRGDKQELAEAEAQRAIALDAGRIGGYRLLAMMYSKAERWNDLDAVLVRARQAVPDDLGPQFQAARFIWIAKKGDQWPRAERYLRNYLEMPVEGGEASLAVDHWLLGLVLEKEGRKAEGLKEVQTAVDLDPAFEGAKKDLKRMKG